MRKVQDIKPRPKPSLPKEEPKPVKVKVEKGETVQKPKEETKKPSPPKKETKKISKKQIIIIGSIIGVLVIATAIVWYFALTSSTFKLSQDQDGGQGRLPLSSNKKAGENWTESPISGIACENANVRPIAVMVASDPITRPLSGLSEADLVIEMPVLVNNVTRLMAVYTCGNPREVGSVRSARHDYLFLAMGLDAIIAHWGGSYHALNRLNIEKIMDNIDALRNPFGAYFRKSTLPAPYNGFTSMEKLRDAAQRLGYRQTTLFAGYPHIVEVPQGQRPQGGKLTVGYPGSMGVGWDYDPGTNSYLRSWGGAKDTDVNNGQRITAKNVVIMRAAQRLARPGEPYNDVDVEGNGDCAIYNNGTYTEGTWSKSQIHKQDKLIFKDSSGNEIPFVPGQIWIEIVDPGTNVNWTQ